MTVVVNELKSGVNAVKSRWGHIHDYFLKNYWEKNSVMSGEAAKGRTKWHVYDALSFLIPVYGPRETCTNLSQEASETLLATDSLDIYSQVSSPMTSQTSSPSPRALPVPHKRAPKREVSCSTASAMDNEILNMLQKSENDDEMWARSLIPSLQKLGHLEKLKFRVEVQSLLIGYLRRQEEEEARGSADYLPSLGPEGDCYSNYSISGECCQQRMS